MTTDADLQLVAETVGFHPTIAHPTPTDLPTKDDCAARWLLPWLQDTAEELGCALHTISDRFSGTEASLWPRDSTTPLLTSSTKPEPVSFAAALFDLCHAIIKKQTPTEEKRCRLHPTLAIEDNPFGCTDHAHWAPGREGRDMFACKGETTSHQDGGNHA